MGSLVATWPTPAPAASEPALGRPATDGQVLASSAAGVRSWVPLQPSMLDAVFSNPASVLAGNPVPTTAIDPVFYAPESVING